MKAIANPERVQLGEIEDRRRTPDRRGSPRRKALKIGRTFWPNGDSSECIVCNISETGAQLAIRGPIPNLFDLVIDGDAFRHSCSVVWRKANRVGVRFQEKSSLAPRVTRRRSLTAKLRRYAEDCRALAERAGPSDRNLLIEMADAWVAVLRQVRINRQSTVI